MIDVKLHTRLVFLVPVPVTVTVSAMSKIHVVHERQGVLAYMQKSYATQTISAAVLICCVHRIDVRLCRRLYATMHSDLFIQQFFQVGRLECVCHFCQVRRYNQVSVNTAYSQKRILVQTATQTIDTQINKINIEQAKVRER